LFSAAIRLCGAFPVVRDGSQKGEAVKTAVEKIHKGRILIIFPEGTRSKDGTIGRGRTGAALIALQSQSPVLPVCIAYNLRRKPSLDFAFGKLITAEEVAAMDTKRLTREIMHQLHELQQQMYDYYGRTVTVKNESLQ
jgi:1-acyl-sn-glycerol-3-phosphate acyltransferase